MLRASLPGMRAARSGHIVDVSSILGLTVFPGWGLHCSAKYALEGLSDSLAAEVAHLGIKVTVVEPGYTRTDSYDLAKARVATLLADIEAGRELARTTDVDDA